MIQTKSTRTSLITLERSQKLDLLIHLISNLRQSLVICGAHGIGKTSLLDELKQCKKDVWSIVTINASSKLSFESIQDQLSQFIKQSFTETKDQELSSVLSRLDKQNQKIVILIDDAGFLVPGLVTSLIQYASANTCLRVIFSMTHDDLYLKNSSDRVINDCHFIEIPPLTEKQCAMFLQNLSAQPDAVISMSVINDKLVEKLYRETQGVPGKIISKLPDLSTYSAKRGYKWLSAVFIVALVLAVGIDFIISEEADQPSSKNKIIKPLVLEKAEVVEVSSPVIQSVVEVNVNETQVEQQDKTDQQSSKNIIKKPLQSQKAEVDKVSSLVINSVVEDEVNKAPVEQLTEKKKDKEDSILLAPLVKKTSDKAKKADNITSVEKPVDEKNIQKQKNLLGKIQVEKKDSRNSFNEITKAKPKVIVEEASVVEKKIDKQIVEHQVESRNKKKIKSVNSEVKKKKNNTSKNSDDTKWVLNQPKKNYTIQLMALSQRASALDFFKKNIKLKEGLRLFHKGKQNQKKYVLIYGSFNTYDTATKKMKSLPEKYRKSWVRSFSILHKEIR